MRFVISFCAVALMAIVVSKPAFAIKPFGDQFGRIYVETSKNEDFKKLVAEAKCNVCHIDGKNKKEHNPYGLVLKEAGFSKKTHEPMFKNNPEQFKKEVEAILKKVEDKKIDGKGKTFGEKIKDGVLPGGDTKGK
ncbi:MAG: hypothetical protein ABL921_29160 [Pirellula sp.]